MTSQVIFPWKGGTLNEVFGWFIYNLVFGKFFIIFSCLFGLSFFIRMDRASKNGVDFRSRFLWRLTLLLAIGYLHGLIVRVDILLIYALPGFVLVLMYKWPTKLLAGITLFLFLGGASFIPVIYRDMAKPSAVHTEQTVGKPVRTAAPRQALSFTVSAKDNAWNGLPGK